MRFLQHFLKHFDRLAFGTLCIFVLSLIANVGVWLFPGQPVVSSEYSSGFSWFMMTVGSYAVGWLADGPIGRLSRRPWFD